MHDEISRPIPPELDDCKPSPGWALIKPLQRTGTRGGLLLATPKGDVEIGTGIRVGRVAEMGEPRQLEFGGVETVRCEKGNTVLYDASKGLIEVNLEGQEHHLTRTLAIVASVKAAAKLYDVSEPPIQLDVAGPVDLERLEARLPRPQRNGSH